MDTRADHEFLRWSEEGRAAYLRAAENALQTYRRYVDMVATATGSEDHERLFEAMWPAARAFADAQLAEASYSGTIGPWLSPREPVPEVILPDYSGQRMVTVLERRDYFLEASDEVRAAVRFDGVTPEAPDEPPPPRSETELLGDVLTSVTWRDGSAAVGALQGLEFSQGLVIALAHDRVQENIKDVDHDTAFDITDDDVWLGSTTFG